ncbi:MAG: topoisomerase [Acidimicrobiales bacterium]|jgi:DNA topoisomerase-1|nr:topoisomerase [Acidimicrobiales bacterium]
MRRGSDACVPCAPSGTHGRMPRLRRVDCSGPGLARRRCGKGFAYLDLDRATIRDAEVLARINALAIPPAWTDVWICPTPNGHIQATGVDARGRRQYRYHDAWRVRRDAEKFDHMITFARALPTIRATTDEHLATGEMSRERALACAVRLLDVGFFRIGTEGYAEENQTFGLATIHKKHVRVDGDEVVFDYVAKSGKRRIQSVVDPDVRDVVTALKARRGGGPELLAYREGGRWRDVKSADINAYLKAISGEDISAKDFRTWHATVLAAVAMAVSHWVPSERGRKRAIARAMDEVAHYLGNTPAVCRSSYVDSRLVDSYMAGSTIAAALVDVGGGRDRVEAAVVDLLSADEVEVDTAA